MKVLITEVQHIGEKCFVLFQSKLGNGKALWNGNLPAVNNEYHVEIEIHDHLMWGDNMISSPSMQYHIKQMNDGLILTGEIESIDDDGYTVIRLGESIVCVEAMGVPLTIGTFVTIHANDIAFFNLNY
ncbi:hypothetical protein [Paenibacillus sp. MMS18-CY102]|uniref:hypothetical protein n=1 Tax=Paenibacillus sp. MMS18-CY102 TaxID=2682849 RepID=UPI001365BDAE|nr:hypothetical protein [Paenibacillus sp. MMS18-CY102]MWC27339.1 hypothetical protein [Paenibacillus sp. MMS18-CY102]